MKQTKRPCWTRHGRSASPRRRAGFLYVAVLFTTLLVMAAVAAALTISTASLRGETDRSSRGDAIRLAEAEIQRQAAIMRTSAAWRSGSNDVFSGWYTMAINGSVYQPHAQVRVRFTDTDGNLIDDPEDSVELTVHAKVGRSEAALTVQMESDPAPLDLLRYSITATDDLQVEGSVTCERPVQLFDDCKSSTPGVLTTPRLECNGNVQVILRGDLAPASVAIPSNDVVATYVALGTQIPTDAIPLSAGNLLIQDVVLAATNNPFGDTDPNGIYWIDAGGRRLILAHSRFQAALAVVNASEVRIEGGINWDYPTKADVILATHAPIHMENIEAVLDETARLSNYNPPGTPYRETVPNLTLLDRYPTELRGVVYSSNNFRLDPLVGGGSLPLTGALIARDIRVDGALSIYQLDEVLEDPPPGLSNLTPMRFVRGTFRRIPSP